MNTNSFAHCGFLQTSDHQQLVGHISEALIAGTLFIRIDVFNAEGGVDHTRFISTAAVQVIIPMNKIDCLARLPSEDYFVTPAKGMKGEINHPASLDDESEDILL